MFSQLPARSSLQLIEGANESRSTETCRRGKTASRNQPLRADLTNGPLRSGWTSKAAHHDVWPNHVAARNWLLLDIYYATQFAVWPNSIPFMLEFDNVSLLFLAFPDSLYKPALRTTVVFPVPFFDTFPHVFYKFFKCRSNGNLRIVARIAAEPGQG